MTRVYFSLGSNEGDRLQSLVKATRMIENVVGKVLQYSPVVETEPWGFDAETSFYNMAVVAETVLTPQQVLTKVLDIEKSLGRVRQGNTYSNRNIDIDILFYGNEMIQTENLTIPHPLLHKRMFVLQPLVSIAPDFIHPGLHASVADMLQGVQETGVISVAVKKEEFARLLIP